MVSARPKLVVMVLLGCLCGCLSSEPKTAPVSPNPPPASASKTVELPTRDNALALLYDLLNDEKRLGLILLIKRETPELKRLVKEIAATTADGAKMLKALMEEDPALKAATTQLPPGEAATRKAIEKTKRSLLLSSKGEEFEFQILLTQVQALDYGAHLAQVAAENEPNPTHAREFTRLSAELKQLSGQVLAMLRTKS